MLSALAVLALSYVSGGVATPTSATVSAPIVNLGYAQYQGVYDATTDVSSFKSIRYAAPPVGSSSFLRSRD